MTDPNVNATPQSVADSISGTDGTGTALGYMITAMLYDGHMFGLGKDYAFPETSNTSASLLDKATTLAKLLTRKQTLADGNDYDLWDCVFTCAKWVLSQNIHINDNEVNSVNYKPPTA